MNGLDDAATFATVAFLLVLACSLPHRPPSTCKACGQQVPRRHIPQHYLDHHQETPMCDRTDWPCHNPEPHDAPHGCVHHSTTGSETEKGD